MAVEMLVGLEVTDEASYQAYRDAIAGLLVQHGGAFRYDFRISEVLKSETDEPINRVFALGFATDDGLEEFFADANYHAIREQYFVPAVGAVTLLARYER